VKRFGLTCDPIWAVATAAVNSTIAIVVFMLASYNKIEHLMLFF
jgi:hypothetical protein